MIKNVIQTFGPWSVDDVDGYGIEIAGQWYNKNGGQRGDGEHDIVKDIVVPGTMFLNILFACSATVV